MEYERGLEARIFEIKHLNCLINKYVFYKIFNIFGFLKYFNFDINLNNFYENTGINEKNKVIIKGRGRNSNTWVHPFLFIDITLAISPKLKIEVYSWLQDELLKYRNKSGDSYKKMAGALYLKQKNKAKFSDKMKIVSRKIQRACNVNDWQEATEEQLELRDKIHENIALLCDVLRDVNQAIKLGVKKSLK